MSVRSLILAGLAMLLCGDASQAQFGKTAGAPMNLQRELAASIVQKGYRRVGVLPQFIGRSGNEETLQGATGPHARLFAEKVEETLVIQAGGQFQVIESRQMKEAFKDLALEDLGKPERLRACAERVGGMDAMIVGIVTDERHPAQGPPALELNCRLIDLATSGLVDVRKETLHLSIAGAAYMGESFELRRWQAGQLVNVGLSQNVGRNAFIPADYNPAQGLSPNDVRRDRPHPLLDPSFPFATEVLVREQPRPLRSIGGRVYVALEPGESYHVRVQNRTDQPVFAALFVDGLNALGKKREHPGSCRYWRIAANDYARFRGWYSGTGSTLVEEEFYITPAEDTVAGRSGFFDALGMITAVLYTVGTPHPQVAAAVTWPAEPQSAGPSYRQPYGQRPGQPSQRAGAAPRASAPRVGAAPRASAPPSGRMGAPGPSGGATFGTGEGERREVRIEQLYGGEPGLILAAFTIYYRTNSQLEQLQR